MRAALLPLALLLSPLAFAATAGYYSPDNVAAASAAFRRYSDALMPRFEKAERDIAVANNAVSELELGVLVLGERAPDTLRAHYKSTRKTVTVSFLQTQAHIALLEDDSAATFGAALERAIAGMSGSYTATECAAGPSGIAAIAGPGRGPSTCAGDDLNAPLAAAIDKDPALLAAIDEILALEWPDTTIPKATQPLVPLTGAGPVYIQVDDLAIALLSRQIEALGATFEEEISPLERGLEAKDPQALADAKAARDRYEAGVSAAGAKMLAAVEKSLKKRGESVALCANPAAFGGCEGEDKTDLLVRALQTDKKVQKALR
ncbi:hypothetical protein L6R49_09785 [Myxococcota bacterium]|nr:hypothetical protein [Myxococcota bacterium]